MKHLTHHPLYALALLTLGAALAGCQLTPPSSSWATDVYRARLSSLKPGVTTADVVATFSARETPRINNGRATYDLIEGYTLTLFFNGDRNHPQEIVLHTPYENVATHWSRQLSEAEQALDAPTTRPMR
jgi:hypothetical protein